MIEVNGLCKKYGNHYAVKDLTFSIEKGKVYGFLGPNGAGKTTTMNIITGYLAASSGTVTVDGHDILKEAEEAKKCIGYLPEIPPLYPEMTVYEFLSFVAELKKVPKAERKKEIEEVMEKTMITDMKDRMIKNLSKGYKQRVGLAQAIMGNPDVIILDEPTVGLDPKQIIEIRELIAELKQNHTVILSSHILSEIAAVCDHIMIISHGKMVASDTVENLNKMMAGESHINLLAKGDEKTIATIIEGISGVESVSTKTACTEDSGSEKKMTLVDITMRKDMDIRDSLSIKLAEAGIAVYELNMTSKSLEDIFLELTESEKKDKENHKEDDDAQTESEETADETDESAENSEETKEATDNDSNL